MLVRYLVTQKMPPLPPSVDWSHVVSNWGMALNDRLSCCVISGATHAIEEWSAANGNERTVDDSQVLSAYESIAGYDPNDPSTDRGTVMLDALNAWKGSGIAGNQLGAYASIGHHDTGAITRLRASIALFGSGYLGFALPETIQSQPHIWSVPSYGPHPGPDGDGTPGSLGGHCVLATGYRLDRATRQYIFSGISWGEIIEFTQGFASLYLDEAYALFDGLWANGSKPAPSGFDAQQLAVDLAAL